MKSDKKFRRTAGGTFFIFLAGKAWAWAGYLYVPIAAVASIGLRIAGKNDFSTLVSGSTCLILVLYWVSYLVQRKKY